MPHALSPIRRARSLTAAALVFTLLASAAPAAIIDLSLNVLYTNGNPASGGTWELVAKSDGFGLSGLQAFLSNVATASPAGPRGLVNGSDPAGFGLFVTDVEPIGFTEIIAGQILLDPSEMSPADEQTAFYGVGTLTNGAPNYPAKPPGTNSIGPAFTSLTNTNGIPWAAVDTFNDPAWATAATLATGTFNAGVTPGFFQSPSFQSSGSIFTSLGNNDVHGNISDDIIVSTIVRTNSTGVILPDYNGNGRVDAADFVLWRKTNGQMGTGLVADGNGDSRVDQLDYDLWRMHFGATVPGAGTSTGASGGLSTAGVPEPGSAVLLGLGAMFAIGPRRLVRASADVRNSDKKN